MVLSAIARENLPETLKNQLTQPLMQSKITSYRALRYVFVRAGFLPSPQHLVEARAVTDRMLWKQLAARPGHSAGCGPFVCDRSEHDLSYYRDAEIVRVTANVLPRIGLQRSRDQGNEALQERSRQGRNRFPTGVWVGTDQPLGGESE